ncbi:MAG: PD-(D/E)XK nuclease family protein [Acidobacteriota bacterium]
MVTLVDVPVGEDLLERALAECEGVPPDGLAVVFPGSRAVHHFATRYARSAGGPCRPPRLCTLESLAARLAGTSGEALEEFQAVALLSEAVASAGGPVLRRLAGDLVAFYGWGVSFLKALATLGEEMVADADLLRLRGLDSFDVLAPPVREFYERYPEIREAFESRVSAANSFTRGQVYARSLSRLASGAAQVPDRILLVGFFSFSRGQARLVEAAGRVAEVTVLRHQDGRDWKAFEAMERLLPVGRPVRHAPCSPPPLEVCSAPSVHAEVLYAGAYLEREGVEPESTVVVLPDTGSLQPLLWDGMAYFPGQFNVTLGYPLARTPLFALFQRVLDLAEGVGEDRVASRAYLNLLLHPYVKNLSIEGHGPGAMRPLAHAIEESVLRKGNPRLFLAALEDSPELPRRARAMQPEGPDEEALALALRRFHDLFIRRVRRASTLRALSQALRAVLEEVAHRSPAPFHPFYRDCFARALTLLDGLADWPGSGREGPSPGDLHDFLRARLREARVPFTGLPVRGLQVMGLLESQALRFDTVLVLDASEDVLPTSSAPDPVLPPSFRKALGLPGAIEREEVYRYHLFRLLEASKRCSILYVDRPDAGRSHFVDQLLYEARRDGGTPTVRSVCLPASSAAGSVRRAAAKSSQMLERLSTMAYSPTSLDAYLRCPMGFYYGHAAGLREREVLEEGDSKGTGKRLHDTLAELYEPYVGQVMTHEVYDQMLVRLPGVVAAHFGGSGEAALVGRLAERRIGDRLRRERTEEAGKTVLQGVNVRLEASFDAPGATVRLRGELDRLDGRAGGLRIVDYKSGKSLRDRYIPRPDRVRVDSPRGDLARSVKSIQLPAYVELLHRARGAPYGSLSAVLLSLRDPREPPGPLFVEPSRAEAQMEGVYLPVIRRILGEILDPSVPFEPDPSEPRACAACPFGTLCGR